MNIPKLTDEVATGKKAHFVYFKNTNPKETALWYKTESGFQFPIPIADTEGADFNAEEKAIIFMRWIRKHIERLKEEAG